jgi:hypothetical protein
MLHLLEDMGVPDHTRDDTHVHVPGDKGSPYEDYASRWTRSSIKELGIASSLGPSYPSYGTVAEYLSGMAQYSNKYFFSKDTVNDPRFSKPRIVREDDDFAYGLDMEGKEIPLARIKQREKSKFELERGYVIEKTDSDLLNGYFSHLSRQVVLNGAGVVRLFQKLPE